MVVCEHAWTFPGCQFCTVYNATVSRSHDTYYKSEPVQQVLQTFNITQITCNSLIIFKKVQSDKFSTFDNIYRLYMYTQVQCITVWTGRGNIGMTLKYHKGQQRSNNTESHTDKLPLTQTCQLWHSSWFKEKQFSL